MSDPLERVKRASSAKRRADLEYRAALVAAVEALETASAPSPYAAVAREAGVSRQAVRIIVARARRAQS